MDLSTEPFDLLCRQVFLHDTSTDPNKPSNEETALSLLSQAQVYEFPASFIPPTTTNITLTSGLDKDRRCYRIHLDSLQDRPAVQQNVHDILVKFIPADALWELPFDRNLSGYSTQSRSEVVEAPLQTNVVLDMGGLESGGVADSNTTDDDSTADDQKPLRQGPSSLSLSSLGETTMLLLPTPMWLRLTGRIRFWRAESHRIKSAEREVKLDQWLDERWKRTSLSSTVLSSPPPSSGSLLASAIPPTSLPSPPVSSAASSPASSPRSSTVPQGEFVPLSLTRPSLYKQPFQEQQLESLVEFMVRYGEELSASSLLKGLLDLCRRQLTETTIYSWTIDRANLTEQKPEVSVAFLDLLARLGFEYVNTAEQQREHLTQLTLLQQGQVTPPLTSSTPPLLSTTTSHLSTASEVTIIDPSNATTNAAGQSNNTNDKIKRSIEIKWTLGTKVDDPRLEYWIHNLQQPTLPVLQMDGGSILPLNFANSNQDGDHLTLPTISSPKRNSESLHHKAHDSHQHTQSDKRANPIPTQVRKRFLQDKHTIPAGTIQVLTQFDGTTQITRDRTFVAATSAYRLTGSEQGSSGGGLFVDKVKNDVKHLARWASTCGGRLDWIWNWLFRSFQSSRRSRHDDRGVGGSSNSGSPRRPRSNDENV
ncbi:hypothetical protein BGZ83_012111 [Gryganskiella cystojenkinii]|nr:hypothetical protein BGZ83_012111 [Gryganskiella cystojenkinii]